MHRLLIAAASAAVLAATCAPAFADDYPPCTHKDQDHCRVVVGPMMGMGPMHHHHAPPPPPPKHHHHAPPQPPPKHHDHAPPAPKHDDKPPTHDHH